MAYQFIHVETYARELKKEPKVKEEVKEEKKDGSKKKKQRTMREIIAEADREPGNCPHIEFEKLADPALAPEHLFGYTLDRVEQEATRWAEQSKDGGGQALRKNGVCLLAGVVSLPDDTPQEDWDKFKLDAIRWLKKEYGSTLRSVIEHKDEAHKHFHFYCIPDAGQQFSSIHKGIEARTKARQQKLSGKEQNLAYCEAMREWQDKFSRDVGQPHGLTRIGPGRRRLTRAQWQQEQQQAKALQQALKRAKNVQKQAEKQAEEITQQAKEKAQKTAGFGASVGGWAAGVAGGWHKPTKEAAEKAAEALESERAKHSKELNDQRKHYQHELAESESARDHLKQTLKEQRQKIKERDAILSKYGSYIGEHEAQEEKEKKAREAEQGRQQREQEERQAEERKQNSRGRGFER